MCCTALTISHKEPSSVNKKKRGVIKMPHKAVSSVTVTTSDQTKY